MKIYSINYEINFDARGEKAFVKKIAKPFVEETKEQISRIPLKFAHARVVIKNIFNQMGKNLRNRQDDIKNSISAFERILL